MDKVTVEINREMYEDLCSARDRLLPISKPYMDLDVFTIIHLIEKYEKENN